MILFLLRIEYLPIYNSSIRSRRLYTAIYRHNVIFTRSRSEAETKRNTSNNFKKSMNQGIISKFAYLPGPILGKLVPSYGPKMAGEFLQFFISLIQ